MSDAMTPRQVYTAPGVKLFGMRRGAPSWANRLGIERGPYAWTERLYRTTDGWYLVRAEDGGEAGCYVTERQAQDFLRAAEDEEAARQAYGIVTGCQNCWQTGSRTIRTEQPCQWCGTSPSYVWPHALDR